MIVGENVTQQPLLNYKFTTASAERSIKMLPV